ncbi:unnamed protein product, partial [Mesorhabditis spiculigera]
MSCAYDTDTLTSAKHNRAASEKFYKQVMPSRTVILNHDLPQMLHRSPSGAKRKIRQRAEERVSRPSPFLQNSRQEVVDEMPAQPPPPPAHQKQQASYSSGYSSNHSLGPAPSLSFERQSANSYSSTYSSQSSSYSSSPSPAPSQSDDVPTKFGSRIIDSGAYKSILPDLQPDPMSRYTAPVEPKPAQRSSSSLYSRPSLNLPLDRQNNHSQIHYASPVRTGPESPVISPNIKPTVAVHPIPSDERSHRESSYKREKPAVPAKPKGLKLNNEMRSTSLSSMISSVTSCLNDEEFFRTPADRSLDDSYEKVPMPNKRNEAIVVVDSRIRQLEAEHGAVEEEIVANEETAEMIILQIEGVDPNLADKLRSHADQTEKLFELAATFQSKKLSLAKELSSNPSEKSLKSLAQQKAWAEDRLVNVSGLIEINNRREKELDQSVCELLDKESQQLWMAYRDNRRKINEERFIIKEQINEGKSKLRALQGVQNHMRWLLCIGFCLAVAAGYLLNDSPLELGLTDDELYQLAVNPSKDADFRDCDPKDLAIAQAGFNMKLGFPTTLTYLNASTLWYMVGQYIKDTDTMVKVCTARQMYYDTLRTEYSSCLDISFLIAAGGAPLQTGVLYIHMMRHLEFMCGGGFDVYTRNMACFLKNEQNPTVTPCFQAFNASIHQDYRNLCPAVGTMMDCVNTGYTSLCGNWAGWTMCEYERVGYALGCQGLRCTLSI